MKRITSMAKRGGKNLKMYAALDDDSAKDSLKSSSVYTSSTCRDSNSQAHKSPHADAPIADDGSDVESKVSTLASNSQGHLELDEHMNYYRTGDNDIVKAIRVNSPQADEKAGIEHCLTTIGQPVRKVAVASRPNTDRTGEDTHSVTSYDTDKQGPLAWYRDSSTSFKLAFFSTCALFFAILVVLVVLFVTQRGDSGNSSPMDLVARGSVQSPAPALVPQAPAPMTTGALVAEPIAAETNAPLKTPTFSTTTTAPVAAIETDPPATEVPSKVPTINPTAVPTMAPTSIVPTAGPMAAKGSAPAAIAPNCVDSEDTFLVNGETRTCAWLATTIAHQMILCKPDWPETFYGCAKTCKIC
jgi:hypothetical protein